MLVRIKIILVAFNLIFFLLISRLLFIQVYQHYELSKRLSAQKFISAPVRGLRGTIYDRNMISLTDNKNEKPYVVILPQLIKNQQETAIAVSEICNINIELLNKNIKDNKPFIYNVSYSAVQKLKDRKLDGVLTIMVPTRYSGNSTASHVLGYVNTDNEGQFGIEKGYNKYLKRNGVQSVGVLSDRFRNPILGWGYRSVETFLQSEKLNVKLTIDYHMQNIVEKAFDFYGYSGAAVLLDCTNGDVLSMVSRPSFDSNNIGAYINSSNKELINKALYPYNLGSVFKIVIAEAALENGLLNENDEFECFGYIDVDGQLKKCSAHSNVGYTKLSFSNAFSESCNTVFIQTGLKLGFNRIVDTARKFRLGQSIGLEDDGLNEDPGLVEYNRYVSNREIANLSIGQGSLLVTPIQVANLINTIANSGKMSEINIVDSIIDDDGNIVERVRKENEQRVFPTEAVEKIKRMMEQVTKTGTGIQANLDEYGGVAGKTSSAETGLYIGDDQIVHAWFAGYFPVKNPRYALSLVVENGKSGGRTAAPLFGEIAYEILSLGY